MTSRDRGTTGRESPLAGLDRRQLLLGLGAAAGTLTAAGTAAAATEPDSVARAPLSDQTQQRQAFYGVHQAGIVTPRPATGLVASFDVLAPMPEDLARLFRTLTTRCAFLMQGGTPPELDPRFPPADSGLLGPVVFPDNLTITVSLGASMFDQQSALANRSRGGCCG